MYVMGIDKHEASRRGRNKQSGAARRRKERDPAKDDAFLASGTTTARGQGRRAPGMRKRPDPLPTWKGEPREATSPLAQGWDAPAVVADARPPAAADGTVLAVTKRAEKLARSDSTDVRLPNSWFGEMSQLTGEPTTSNKPGQIRALIVLARGLLRKG